MAMGAGAEVVLISAIGDNMEYAIWLHLYATNNVAEYEALIHSLKIASELGAHSLFVRGDSVIEPPKLWWPTYTYHCHNDLWQPYLCTS
jgi:ribonuclease HI